MSIFSNFKNRLSGIAIHVKGVDSNRVALPRPSSSRGGGYGGAGDYYGDLLDAIRGVNLNGSKIDFRKEAGDFRKNSIVSLCQGWIGTSFPQAPPRVGKMKNGEFEPLSTSDDHPLIKLLNRPNSRYNGKWLTWSLTSDWWPAGDAYCHIVTNGRTNLLGEPVELEWIPAQYLRPDADNTGRLSHYVINTNGTERELDPREVVHHRFGVDPFNMLRGLSPLLAQDRYILADNSGGAYSAGLLLHGGIPPALLVPETPPANVLAAKVLTREDAETLTQNLAEKFKDEPGKLHFLSNAVKLLMLGYKPSEMALNELLEEPETRIPAAYGIPPEVIKLRVGLLHSTENNIEQSRKMAWEDCLVPCQDLFADVWTQQLLIPRYGQDDLVVVYDRSKVGVLQPDKSIVSKDAATLFTSGIIDRASAKRRIGEKPLPEDEGVYSAAKKPQDDPDQQDPKTQKKTLIRVN